MPTYEFSLPDGQSFEIDSPTELNHDQLSYVASNHKQFLTAKQPQPPSIADDLISGAKGTAAFVGDVASGLAKIPVQAAATTMAKVARPEMNLNELWNAAGQSIEGYTPSFGSKIPDNSVYNTAMKPFELYGKAADYVAEKAGEATGSEDVKGALRIAANFVPIPFMGHAVKGGKAVLNRIDPALRDTVKAPVNKIEALDQIAPRQEEIVTPGQAAGEVAAPIDRAYMEQRRAQEQALQGPDISPQVLEQRRQTAEMNQAFLDDLAKRRAEKEQANTGPQPDYTKIKEEALAKEISDRNQAFLQEQEANRIPEQHTVEPRPSDADIAARQKAESEAASIKSQNEQFLQEQARNREQLAIERSGENSEFPQYHKDQAKFEAEGILKDAAQAAPGFRNADFLDTIIRDRKEKEAAFNDLSSRLDSIQQEYNTTKAPIKGSVGGYPTIKVAKRQRGGINIDAVSKVLGNAVNRVKTALNSLPGHDKTGTDFLAQYPDVTETVTRLKSELPFMSDKAAKWESFRSGSSMKYIETQHPVIKAAADYMQTAYQRADRTIMQVVKPIEHELQKFAWNDKQGLVELGQLFKKEMFERRTFTPEQLKQAGFSDKQVGLYSKMREAYTKAWEKQNEVLKAKGLPELSKHEYYLSSRWTGDWRSNVYDKDGHLVWVIKDHSKKGVEQALAHLESQGIEFDKEKSQAEFTRNNRGTPQDMPAAYASMMQHITESNPLAQKVREVMDAKMMDTAHATLSQSKHFKNKANIRGFVGDRPWMNPFEDARDMFNEQTNYLKNSIQWSEYNKASDQLKTIINDPDIVKQAPKATAQANHIIDHYLGSNETRMFQRLEDSLAKSTGVSRQDIQNKVNFAKTGWILQKMGTNAGALVQNIIQPVNTIPFHTILSEGGYKHNPVKTILASTVDTIAGLANHYGNKLGGPNLAFSSKIGRDALQYAEQNGILNLSAFDEHTNVNSSRGQVILQRSLGMPVMTADKISRFSAFMSFVHHLEQSGKFSNKMELFREAEHYTNASMVDPRMPERPFVIQDTGAIGSAASTLQGYTMNYLNQFHMLANRAVKEGKPTALLEFMAISGALSGIAGMTAVNYGAAGYDALRNQIAKIKPEWYDSLPDLERMLLVDVGEGMGKVGEAMKYGVPSALSGADLSKKFETTVSAPIVGPVADIAQQAGTVAKGLVQGDTKGLTQAAYAVAPTGIGQGLLDVDSGAFQDKKSGKYAPPSSGDYSKGYFRSDTDKLMRRLGVTSIPESRQKEIIYQRAKADANDKLVNNGLADKYITSIMEGEGFKGKNAYVANLVQRAPDQAQQLIQASMQKYIISHNLDAQTISLLKARHLQAIQNWQKYYGANNAAK